MAWMTGIDLMLSVFVMNRFSYEPTRNQQSLSEVGTNGIVRFRSLSFVGVVCDTTDSYFPRNTNKLRVPGKSVNA